MGVPYLFRHIIERYPCIIEVVHEHCIPCFDNFYIDMNGIIYNFANDDEEQMFKDIFTFIEKLVCLIKPQRLLYMGVDGVAPQAKFKQMRLGRYGVAKSTTVPFNPNCITPGTEFMDRFHEALRVFSKNKISTDSHWQRCRVILSGYDAPGEGEHKIMDYIRYLKFQKNYDPHTTHCIYGSDADLFILALCSHELHFAILRNQLKYGVRSAMEEAQFLFLHLGILREYLQMEFSVLRQYESFSMSKLVDDWVFMTLLFGNDFIPCLKFLDMSMNDLPLVYQTYMKVYPKLGGNINEKGTLNLERLEIFMEALSEVQFSMFQHSTPACLENYLGEDYVLDGNKLTEKEFELFKRNYYTKTLSCEELTPKIVSDFAKSFVEGLQWISLYYYKGVPSWSWYYAHYGSPFLSDLKNLKDLKFEFSIGKPLLHFELLLAVLPAANRSLIPSAYQDLLVSPTSEIIHFYPDLNELDENTVLAIVFLDVESILTAMKKCNGNLTPDEVKRNRHGPMLQYDYTAQSEGEQQFCTEKPLWNDQISIPSESNQLVELKIPNRNAYVPGFPTMKNLLFKFQLRNAGIRVLAYPSKYESMILNPKLSEDCNDIDSVKRKYLDRIVYIGWPYLIKAKVVRISNEKLRMTANENTANNSRMFEMEVKSIREHLLSRWGIVIDQCHVLVHVRILIGMPLEYESRGKFGTYDVWSEGTMSYPAGMVVCDPNLHKRYTEPYRPSFGSDGTVLSPEFKTESGRLKIRIRVYQNPDLSEAIRLQTYLYHSYLSPYQIQSMLGLRSKSIIKLTSLFWITLGERSPNASEDGKTINIGLQMRFPQENEELFGYTRKADDNWLYSPNAVATIKLYIEKFPMVNDYILRRTDFGKCFESDVFPGEVGKDHAEKVVKWIAEQDFNRAERVPCGTKTVEKKPFEKIIESVEKIKTLPLRTVELQVHREYPIRLFDRVVVVRNTYTVPIGSTGTVISIIPASFYNPVAWECVKQISYFLDIYFDTTLQCDKSFYGLGVGRVMRVPEIAVLTIPN